MEGLYRKIVRGEFNKIPDVFSRDLYNVVKMMIQVDSDLRPSCEQILKNEIVFKKIEIFKEGGGDDFGIISDDNKGNDEEDKNLMKTITLPKNLMVLSHKLPEQNYSQNLSNVNTVNTVGSNSNVSLIAWTNNNISGINNYGHCSVKTNINLDSNIKIIMIKKLNCIKTLNQNNKNEEESKDNYYIKNIYNNNKV